MPLTRLDPIDRLILSELQANGRMTNVELAKRVGISAPPCLRRVRALEEQGFINEFSLGSKIWDVKPNREAATASIFPNCPPPKMPILDPGLSILSILWFIWN